MDLAVDSHSLPRMQAKLTLTVHLPVGKIVASVLFCVLLAPGEVERLGIGLAHCPLPADSLTSVPPDRKDWGSHFKVPGALPLSW